MDFFLLRGLKRSGNHLFVNWLRSFYQRPTFHNNIWPRMTLNEIICQAKHAEGDAVIFSIEKPNLLGDEDIDLICGAITKHKSIYHPFIMRDPFNWMASMLQMDGEDKFDFYWDLWLKTYELWKYNSFKINFNHFVTDRSYRAKRAAYMGKQFNPTIDYMVMNTLWEHEDTTPIPSSFDSERVKNGTIQPNQMKVLERYKAIKHLFVNIPDKIKSICAREEWEDILNEVIQ